MLYVHEKVAKLGGIYLGGQVSSVEIQESATIYVAQDDKGKVKQTQPVGYENAKVLIDIILEDGPDKSAVEQLTDMERLFRGPGQEQAKLFAIVNEDCAARGISEVYFKSLASKQVVSESKRIASLELWAPKTAEIRVVKTTETAQKSSNNTSTKATDGADSAASEAAGAKTADSSAQEGRITAGAAKAASDVIKGVTSTKKAGPAQDTRITAGAIKTASELIKGATGRRTTGSPAPDT